MVKIVSFSFWNYKINLIKFRGTTQSGVRGIIFFSCLKSLLVTYNFLYQTVVGKIFVVLESLQVINCHIITATKCSQMHSCSFYILAGETIYKVPHCYDDSIIIHSLNWGMKNSAKKVWNIMLNHPLFWMNKIFH